jgi:hypothetical protein
LTDLGVDGKILIHWIFKEYDGRMCTGFIWLKTGNTGGQF